MAFDLASAQPVGAAPPGRRGFDLASAQPVNPAPASQVPSFTLPEADPVTIYETDPNTGQKTSRLQQPSGTSPRKSAAQKQADIDRAAELRAPDRTWRDDTPLGNLMGLYETGLGLASAAATPVIAVPGGFIKSMVSGGDPETNASQIAERIAFKPTTGTAQQLLRGIGHAAAPLGQLPFSELNTLGRAASSAGTGIRRLAGANAAAQGAEDAAMAAGGRNANLLDLVRKPKAAMPGVGAASTSPAGLRVAAADQLPVPMGKLMTKGMRSRAKGDLAFENIAAKDPELGAGLRNRTVEINQAALDNFDAFAESTGAQGQGLRPAGKVVDDYLIRRVDNAKTSIRKAYNDAAESVEGKTPADTAPLRAYLDKYRAEAAGPQGVPALKLVNSLLDEFDPQGTGAIPLKAFNEIRERVGKISPEGSISSAYKKPIQDLVDAGVEANGGPLYRTARREYENYQNEFKNAGAIDRLLRTKPGTKDRATALEDVVTKSTLDAPSTDAVRQVKSTLTRKQDAEGLQAWKEVQGETARQIKERVTTGSAKNEGGAREVSPAALDKIVRELDADGRLDVIFSKKGAQQWRDLRDTILEMKTVPAGTVSSSGTAEVLAGLLDTAVTAYTGVPTPVASALNFGVKRLKKANKTKKIERALNPDGGE